MLIEDNTEADVYFIHKLDVNVKPYEITLNVDHKNMVFEIDTGSGLTIVSEVAPGKT